MGHKLEIPEFVIGICGAVGTDLAAAEVEVRSVLLRYDLEVKSVRVSDLISSIHGKPELKGEHHRIDHYMDCGNSIRNKKRSGAAIAHLIVAKLEEIRTNELKIKTDCEPAINTVFLINSLKHPEEYKFMKNLYGDAFVMLSFYDDTQSRKTALQLRIAKSLGEHSGEKFSDEAEKLIARDQSETSSYGQSVRDVFPLADAFIDMREDYKSQTQRTIAVMLRAPFVTPTVDEYGMFHAFSAALRSSDLSRQVGSVIVTPQGNILSSGCNEVPRIKGGHFWEGEDNKSFDRRDHVIGYDASSELKQEILKEIIEVLFEFDAMKDEYKKKNPTEIANEWLSGSADGEEISLKGKRISSVLEYGRILHAEMSALMDAAKRGQSVSEAILYCTTFPCHMCARHIIGAGIHRVVYVEPYPKSLAKRLYKLEISVESDIEAHDEAVRFQPFVGIAPKNYMDWFKAPKRKDIRGHAVLPEPSLENRRIANRRVNRSVEELAVIKSNEQLFSEEGQDAK